MANLDRYRQRHIGRHLETLGLEPEIMRQPRIRNQQKSKAAIYILRSRYYISFKHFENMIDKSCHVQHNIAIIADICRLQFAFCGVCGVNIARILILVAVVCSSAADAHMGTGLPGGFISGFLHPLSGPDHMLAMISVGLWGAFLGRPLLIILPMLFPALMAVGGALGMAGVMMPPVELGIAVSVIVLGLVILFAVRATVPVACTIVAIFALFHGYAHGHELPSAADPVGYSVGFVLATGLLHLAGIALGMLRTVRGGEGILRAGGGLIALAGFWFLGQATYR